jgi:NADPH-dependent ferric siderophore reductase
MNRQKEATIRSGTVLENTKIAAHTYHIRIQSNDFARMEYVAGFTVDLFLGNPFYDRDCEDRKYSFWNYEPVYNIAYFAICTFSNGKGAEWVQQLKKGDTIFFKPPQGKLLVDKSAESYLLIGDITALSHLYEINRNLAVSKSVFSYIYAELEADLFPDIDGSFPFSHHIITPAQPGTVVNKIIAHLPKNLDDTIAYIFRHPEICIALHNFLKHERNMPLQNLRTKPFWKTEKEKAGDR